MQRKETSARPHNISAGLAAFVKVGLVSVNNEILGAGEGCRQGGLQPFVAVLQLQPQSSYNYLITCMATVE